MARKRWKRDLKNLFPFNSLNIAKHAINTVNKYNMAEVVFSFFAVILASQIVPAGCLLAVLVASFTHTQSATLPLLLCVALI